jgi:catechol 2,3-dioxygenase-like lactoylglutathione lyase family enzyme
VTAVIGASVVWLPVSDLDRAVEFYRDRLGLQERQHESDWAELEADGLRLGLNARESPGGSGGAVIAFRPRDGLDRACAELREQAVEFADGISEHPWGRVAPFKDPDGNDLQLYEPPKAS